MKYFRLLRLEDQYLQFISALAAGVYLGSGDWLIFWWAIASTFLSFTAFIINEITDRHDSDKYSWNPVHVGRGSLNMRVVGSMFLIFSVSGLVMSYRLGFLWWGLAIYVLGILYSLEPIRLKRRFGLDVAAQLCVWWILPFLAPVWAHGNHAVILSIVIIGSFLVWPIFFPYQLSDFVADQKAGFQNTHIQLGMFASLQFGYWLGIIGLILFGVFRMYILAWWMTPLVFMCFASLFLYRHWMRMSSVADQTSSMRQYVGFMKPLTQLLVPYFLILWFFVGKG